MNALFIVTVLVASLGIALLLHEVRHRISGWPDFTNRRCSFPILFVCDHQLFCLRVTQHEQRSGESSAYGSGDACD